MRFSLLLSLVVFFALAAGTRILFTFQCSLHPMSSSPWNAPKTRSYSPGSRLRGGTTPTDIRQIPRLTQPQIRARGHAIMVRDCEPEIREHVAMRVRKRAEIQKRETKPAGRPTPVARAIPPH